MLSKKPLEKPYVTEGENWAMINNQHVKESIIFMSFEQSRYFVCNLNFGYVGQKLTLLTFKMIMCYEGSVFFKEYLNF